MENKNDITKSRAYKVVKKFLDEGQPLNEEMLFNYAYMAYQTGKHKSPFEIKQSLRQAILELTKNK